MASTYLQRAASGSVTSDKIFTISTWLKKSANGVQQRWFNHENESSHTQKLDLHFLSTDLFRMGWWDGSSEYNLDTKRKFLDTNAWYHFVFRLDTTQSTASDRVRLYVNGELQELTAIGGGSPTYPTLNKTMNLGQKKLVYGRYQAASPNHYWNGLMTHAHYCDGQSYAPTEFGETDATTGEWSIKTNVNVTYGNNGHFILKDGNSVTDQSGNSNNFTVGAGTLTKTEDSPSNSFCTMQSPGATPTITFTNANTGLNYSSSVESGKGTLAFSSGKFYWEAKLTVDTNYPMLGIGSYEDYRMQSPLAQGYPGQHTNSYGAYGNGNIYANGSNTGSQSFTWSTNDIIGIAVDLDSGTKTIKWFKNGSQIATYNITASSTFSPYDYNGGEAGAGILYNFGNGYFGTTAVSSAGTNASNNGIFEYDVPSGYTALSTKGLNL